MNRAISKKIGILSIFCIAMMTFALYIPLTCYGAEMGVDFSPKIINIESERLGEIRVFTDMRYSAFVADGHSIFIYFNGSNDSVPNIRATRDSWGNLILKFYIKDLLVLETAGFLLPNADNDVEVVVTMEDGGAEYSGDDTVYLLQKQPKDRR